MKVPVLLRAGAVHDILLISGTRPEIIKLAPVYHALRDAPLGPRVTGCTPASTPTWPTRSWRAST